MIETTNEDQHPKYDLDGIFNPARAHPDDVHSILMRLVPVRTQVIELGCSSGYLSGYMEREKKCRVTGLEPDPVATKIAGERCSEVHTVDLDNPTSLDIVTGQYDVLLAAAVLEHLKYPDTVLNTLRPKLRPRATVLVNVPNIAHWSMRLKLLRG